MSATHLAMVQLDLGLSNLSDLPVDTFLAVGSAAMTAYFWLVRVRQERPLLTIHQLADYRASLRRSDTPGKRRLCLSQIDTGGVLVANHSVRQNSILRFDCFLQTAEGEIRGDWGWTGDDRPPWNIAPETTIALSPACFFEVPEDYQTPDELSFRIELITVSDTRFAHELTLSAPRR